MGGTQSLYLRAQEEEQERTQKLLDNELIKGGSSRDEIQFKLPPNMNKEQGIRNIVDASQQHRIQKNKLVSGEINKLLNIIQMDILAHNYNQKNNVILNKLEKELNEKKGDAKDNREANYADYTRIEFIEKEIKEKQKTIYFLIISFIVILVLLLLLLITFKAK
jgi:hypothetical protein